MPEPLSWKSGLGMKVAVLPHFLAGFLAQYLYQHTLSAIFVSVSKSMSISVCPPVATSRWCAFHVIGSLTLQMRTMVGTAVNGYICAVEASGMRSMSDSSMVWKPRMDEPSKPRPSSKMPSFSSETGIEKCCQRPGRSIKRRSMILTPFSLAIFNTSFGVMRSASFAMTWEQNAGPAERRWPAGPDTLCGCQEPVKTAAFLARGTLGLGAAHRLRKRATAAAAHAVFSVGRAAEGIGRLRVLREVEARHFIILVDAQSHDGVEHLEDDHRHDEAEHDGRRHRDDLLPHLAGVAVAEPLAPVG